MANKKPPTFGQLVFEDGTVLPVTRTVLEIGRNAQHGARIQRNTKGASKKRPAIQGYCRKLSDKDLKRPVKELFERRPPSWQEETATDGQHEYSIYRDKYRGKPALFWNHDWAGKKGHIYLSTFKDYVRAERLKRRTV